MKDVFGLALYSYWKGDRKTPYIIRRDDDYLNTDNPGIYFVKKLYPSEQKVIKIPKGKILDVGCGAGRHTLYFQERGFDITGIDTSAKAIKVCKARGCKNVKTMDIFHVNLPTKSFDTILLFGRNIGISGTLSGAKKLLKKLKKIIKTDGVLLLTSVDVTKTKNKIHKEYHKKCRKAGRYPGSVKMRIEYKDKVGDWFHWLHLEPVLLKKIAKETGWKVVRTHILKESGYEYSAVLQAI